MLCTSRVTKKHINGLHNAKHCNKRYKSNNFLLADMTTLQEICVECKAAGEYLRFHPEREGYRFLQSHYQNNKLSMCCNKLFEDEDFPACGSSIDIDSAFSLEQNSKWLRPKVEYFIN